MKKISILLIFIIALSCKKETKPVKTKVETKTTQTTIPKSKEKTTVKITTIVFLKDVKSLEKDTSKNPIENFKKRASGSVKRVIKINKNNIEASLIKAKDYKYAVITVGDYTILKITDLDNCKPSGSWKACMPKGEGYIKKGKLIYQNDYINNIIGLPDNKERLLYLF
ncbi:hypothetical protein [Lacinutrix jangbogonensis]|uniref:hypothetical protein n=1 Tax=Lacinutrix jangbogonensis TaxID=1469557 RepID=UPI00053E0F12|nr:hypothetical protein [Lacinutrix jangbogonensis]